MSRCDAYTGGLQSASAALAEAFDAFTRALDDFDPADYAIEVPVGAHWPPWGKAPPGCPIPPAKGMTRVDRTDQRTVKAGVRL